MLEKNIASKSDHEVTAEVRSYGGTAIIDIIQQVCL